MLTNNILPCDRPPLSEEEALEIIRGINRDPGEALENLYTIKTKQGKLQTLRMNNTQRFLHDIWELLRAKKLPIRIDLLKYRQGGLSTYIDGRLFLGTAFKKGITTWKISHNEASVKHLFSMSQLAHEHLPDLLRPQTTYSNRTELIFATKRSKTGQEGLNSQIQILPAKSAQGTRSFTIQNVHCSEVAFWPDGDITFTALLSAIPENKDTAVVVETTANGEGNFFYKRFIPKLHASGIDYHPKKIKSGETWNQIYRYVCTMAPGQFIPVFIPWTLSEECSQEAPANFVPNAKEEKLIEEFGLTLDQVFWRRNQIAHNHQGNEDKFKQEFPLTPEEAFLRTGSSRFNPHILSAMTTAVKRSGIEPDRFMLHNKSSADAHDFSQIAIRDGEFRLWAPPHPDDQFVIGGDTSEGVSDFHSAHVLRVERARCVVVAALHCLGSIKLFARKFVWLAKYFNRAFVGIEANSGGLYAVMYVADHYNNCYQREAPDELEPTISAKEGWKTTSLTRPLLLADLDEAVNEGSLIVPCLDTIDEMKTFVRSSEGRYSASEGNFDDRVMSLGIALQMAKARPYSEKKPKEYYVNLSSVLGPKSKITGY